MIIFRISRESRFPRQASRIWKGDFVCDLEAFDFLRCERLQTRENSSPIHARVVRVRDAKATETDSVCVAVIGYSNIRKVWTP
jgi:hypothetical protein